MVDREQRQLQAIEHAQFVEDVRKMMFHGLVAQAELLRNLLVRLSVNNFCHNLQLAGSQVPILRWYLFGGLHGIFLQLMN